jgi:signal transduction histidine kinase
MRYLLVEDEPRVARFIAKGLREQGFAVDIAQDGISLTLDMAEDITFYGDEDLLRRLIMNLLDNAIKYTRPGGSVFVGLVCEQAAVKIIISDTGIGIPVESASHIFERFYRVDKARSRADGGSGLGLAIARWVAEAHKGSIDLTSSPGRGQQVHRVIAKIESIALR